MLEFQKETKEKIKKTYDHIKNQIDQLEPITCELSESKATMVKCEMFCSLIDGKVMSVLTDSPGVVCCPVCFVTPTQMNNIENFGSDVFEPKPGTIQFGIYPLHMWIRFFECLLHISYRHELKVWKVCGKDRKEIQKGCQ